MSISVYRLKPAFVAMLSPFARGLAAAGARGPSLFAAKREKAFPSSFPPSPPSLPRRAFTKETYGGRGDPTPKAKRSVYSLFVLSIEIIAKMYLHAR